MCAAKDCEGAGCDFRDGSGKMLCSSHASSLPFTVHRFASNGNLRSFLSRSEDNKRKMWRLLYQAVLGLKYIHSKGVTHGNLKLSNILVDADGNAQLADFGLHTLRTCATLSSDAPQESGTDKVYWLAPKYLARRPTFASDMYSFAMCMFEAVTEEPPYALLCGGDIRDCVRSGDTPGKPDGMTDDDRQRPRETDIATSGA